MAPASLGEWPDMVPARSKLRQSKPNSYSSWTVQRLNTKVLRSFETLETLSPTTRRRFSQDLSAWNVFRISKNLNTREHVNCIQVARHGIQLQNFVSAVMNIGVS
jgi:hypothetical protein